MKPNVSGAIAAATDSCLPVAIKPRKLAHLCAISTASAVAFIVAYERCFRNGAGAWLTISAAICGVTDPGLTFDFY